MGTKQAFDRKILYFMALLIFWAVPLAHGQGLFEEAQEEPEEKEQGSEKNSGFIETSSIEFNGYVRGDLYVGKVNEKDVTEIKSGYAEAAAKLKAKMGKWGDGRAEMRMRYGYQGSQVEGTFDLHEAFANLYLGPFDIRFGHQIIAWGRADAFNPTDNLTPRDMRVRSPDEDDRRAANLAIRTWLNFSPLRWEIVYIPFYAPSHFPDFALPGPITFAEADYPDTDFEHGIAATRLNFELAEVDFSVSYLFGYSTFPGLGYVELQYLQDPVQLAVQFRAYQQHVAGADFSTAIGDLFGLRGEVAYRHTLPSGKGEHVPLPDLQYVLGVDREFGDVSIILQYVGRTVFDWEELPAGSIDLVNGGLPSREVLEQLMANPITAGAVVAGIRNEIRRNTRMIAGQTTRFSHALTARVAWKLLQETLTLELLGFYNFSTEEWLLMPKITYMIADGLKASAGAEIFGGPDGTMYGTIDQMMSAGFLELKAYF
jgi:hypothetical protein